MIGKSRQTGEAQRFHFEHFETRKEGRCLWTAALRFSHLAVVSAFSQRPTKAQTIRRAPANICGPVHRLLGTKPIVAGLSRRRTPNVKTSTNGLSFSPCPPELRSFRLCDHVMSLWHKHCTFIGDWDCWSPVWYRAPPGRFISSPAAYLCGTSKAMQRLAEQGKGHTGRKLAASRYSVSRS